MSDTLGGFSGGVVKGYISVGAYWGGFEGEMASIRLFLQPYRGCWFFMLRVCVGSTRIYLRTLNFKY